MSDAAPGAHSPDSAELLDQLRNNWRALPNRTLVSMAMGGLRVRMMRSAVTMLSIVLAIAFLSYTGLTSQLAQSLSEGLTQLRSYSPIDNNQVVDAVDKALQADPTSKLDPNQKRYLAIFLGLDDINDLAKQLPDRQDMLAKKIAENETVRSRLESLEADPDASRAEKLTASDAAARGARNLETLRADVAEQELAVELGHWLDSDDVDNPPMQAHLDQVLSDYYQTQIRTIAQPSRFLDEDTLPRQGVLPVRLRFARRMVQEYRTQGGDVETAQVLLTAIDQEATKRDAALLDRRMRRAGIDPEQAAGGAQAMDWWLIIMAMLTCAVGIANAMLMSVTERIREIGTMKCLGAQDNLVVKLFLMESGFLGVVGAIIGIALGILVSILAAIAQFGGHGFSHYPWLGMLEVIALSVIGGIVLAVVGAVYPAFAAARMKPVDALRVDE